MWASRRPAGGSGAPGADTAAPGESAAESDPAAVRGCALDLLARREHSRAELRDKLARRGFAGDAVTAALDALAAERLQSDRRFAEAYVASRAGRGVGPVRISEELRQRGVDGAERDAACDPRDPDWTRRARAARSKRFGDAPPQDLRERARQARFLTGRGFTGDQVVAALGADPDAEGGEAV